MKCSQNNCNNNATQIVYWPGQTTFQCNACTEKLISLANFMGFTINYNPIKVIELDSEEEYDD